MKLNLASGNMKREGWVNVDIAPETKPDLILDLFDGKWPWDTGTVDEVYSSHFLEHLPDLLPFMNECHRVLKPSGKARFICPYYTSIRAWQDPTHKRAISEHTFHYFSKAWREHNGLLHYPISADFKIKEVGFHFPEEMRSKPQEELDWMRVHLFNSVTDIEVELEALKT